MFLSAFYCVCTAASTTELWPVNLLVKNVTSISISNKKCHKKMSRQSATLIKKDFGPHLRGINQQQEQHLTLDGSLSYFTKI